VPNRFTARRRPTRATPPPQPGADRRRWEAIATGGSNGRSHPSGWNLPLELRLQTAWPPPANRIEAGGWLSSGAFSKEFASLAAERDWRRIRCQPGGPCCGPGASARPLGLSSMAELFADLFGRPDRPGPGPSSLLQATLGQGRLATALSVCRPHGGGGGLAARASLRACCGPGRFVPAAAPASWSGNHPDLLCASPTVPAPGPAVPGLPGRLSGLSKRGLPQLGLSSVA